MFCSYQKRLYLDGTYILLMEKNVLENIDEILFSSSINVLVFEMLNAAFHISSLQVA